MSSALISDRVSQLRNTYIDVVEQAAQVVENSGAQSLPALSALLKDGGRILLVDEKGNYTALDGSSRLIDDTGRTCTTIRAKRTPNTIAITVCAMRAAC